jgi:hypothetical protein
MKSGTVYFSKHLTDRGLSVAGGAASSSEAYLAIAAVRRA